MEFDVGYVQLFQEDQEHVNNFSVNLGVIHGKNFHVDLVELPITSFLWPFMSEHRPDGVKLAHSRLQMQLVLDECPNHRGGGLGAQGEKLAVAVREGVHFLFDNIGALPYTARKKLGLFKNGYTYLLIAEVGEDSSRHRFDPLPLSNIIGQDIVYAFDTCDCHG
jgi:hypothetical protein